MNGYLLDSDVLIDFFKKKSKTIHTIQHLAKNPLTISILSITELRSGWSTKEAAFFLPRLYKLCKVLPLTLKIAEEAGILRRYYKAKGHVLTTVDTLIAAQAIAFNIYLVTGNKKHFPMPKVKLYKNY